MANVDYHVYHRIADRQRLSARHIQTIRRAFASVYKKLAYKQSISLRIYTRLFFTNAQPADVDLCTFFLLAEWLEEWDFRFLKTFRGSSPYQVAERRFGRLLKMRLWTVFSALSASEAAIMQCYINWHWHLHQLHVSQTRTCYGDRSFLVNGPAVWNSLSVKLRSLDMSLNKFKDKLKTFLFRTV